VHTSQPNSHEHAQRLVEFVSENRVGILLTRPPHGALTGRPMSVVNDDVEDAAVPEEALPLRITFITNARNNLVAEINEAAEAAVTFQNKTTQCFVRGRARVSEDRARLRRLWSKGHDIWFEHGVDDPLAVLVDIDLEFAEYWDASGAAGFQFALEAGRALLTGDTVNPARAGRHAELDRPELAGAAADRGRTPGAT